MDKYITGAVIKELREKNNLTQAELAEKLCISDKAVSKWETGRGYPDISLLESIARVFKVSVTELIEGDLVRNVNVSANVMRSKFYVCPVCSNVIHAMGEAVISCHGVILKPSVTEETDESHKIFIEKVEDEYFVQIEHDMNKTHYISFMAALSYDNIQLIKLYPEGESSGRFKMRGVKKIVFYCNRDGLFGIDVIKAIDGRETSYDDTKERRELEKTAEIILG